MSTRKSIAGTHYEEEDQSVRRSQRIRRLSTDSNNTRAASPMLRMNTRNKTNNSAAESDDGRNTPTKNVATPIRTRRSSIRSSMENLSNINPPLITTRRIMALSLEKLKTNSLETKINNEEEIDNQQLAVVNEETEELAEKNELMNVSGGSSVEAGAKNKTNKRMSDEGAVDENHDEMNDRSNKSENGIEHHDEQKMFAIEEEEGDGATATTTSDNDMRDEITDEKQNKKKLNESIKTPVSKSNHTPHTSTPYPFSAIKRFNVTNPKMGDSNSEKRSDKIKKSLSMSIDKESIEEESIIVDGESATNNSADNSSEANEKEKHEDLSISNGSSTNDQINAIQSVKGRKLSLSFGSTSPSTKRSLNQSKQNNTSNIKNTTVDETKQIDEDDDDENPSITTTTTSPLKSINNKSNSKSFSMESKNITPVKGFKSNRMSLNNNEPKELLTINDYKKIRAEKLENVGNNEERSNVNSSTASSSTSFKSADDDIADRITISESDESVKKPIQITIDEQLNSSINSMEIDNDDNDDDDENFAEKSISTNNQSKDSDENEDDDDNDNDQVDDDDNEADEIRGNKSLNKNVFNNLENNEVDDPCTSPTTDNITNESNSNNSKNNILKNMADSSNDSTDRIEGEQSSNEEEIAMDDDDNDDEVTQNNSNSLKKREEKGTSTNRKSLDKNPSKKMKIETSSDDDDDDDFDPNADSTDNDDEDEDDKVVKKGNKDLRLEKDDSDFSRSDEKETKKLNNSIAKQNTSKNVNTKSDKKLVNNQNTSKTMETMDDEIESSDDDFDENAASSTEDDDDDDDDKDKDNDNEEIPMADADDIAKNNSINLKKFEQKKTSTNRKSLDKMTLKQIYSSNEDTSSNDDDFDPDADSTDEDENEDDAEDDVNDEDDADNETAKQKSNLSQNMKKSFEKKQTNKSPIKKNIKGKDENIPKKDSTSTNEIDTKDETKSVKSVKKQPIGQGINIAEIMNRCQSFLEIQNDERSKLKSENQVKKQEKLDRIKRKNELKLIVRAKRMENEEKMRGEEILKKIQLKEKKVKKNARKLAENEEKLLTVAVATKEENNKIDEILESDESPTEIKNILMKKHNEPKINNSNGNERDKNKINVISKKDKEPINNNLAKKIVTPLNDKEPVVKQNQNIPNDDVVESQKITKLSKKMLKKNKRLNAEVAPSQQKSTVIVPAEPSTNEATNTKVEFVKNSSKNKPNQLKKQKNTQMTQEKIEPNEKKQKKNTEKKSEVVEEKVKPEAEVTVNVKNANKKSNKIKQNPLIVVQTKKTNEIKDQGKSQSTVSVASTSAAGPSTSSSATSDAAVAVTGTKRKIDKIIEAEQKKQQQQDQEEKSALPVKKHKKLNIMEMLESKGPKHLENLSTINKVEAQQKTNKNVNLEKQKIGEISEVSKIYEYQKLINKSNIQKANDNILKLSKKSKGIQKIKGIKKPTGIKEPQIVLPKPIFQTPSGQFVIQDFNPSDELHHIKNNPNITVKPLMTTKKSNHSTATTSSIIPPKSLASADSAAFIPICKASSSSSVQNTNNKKSKNTNQADFKYNALFNNKKINRISSKELLQLKQKMKNKSN